MTAPDVLPAAWRNRAAELERFAPPAAEAFRAAAQELEDALRAESDELLTLTEAAAESGYSARRLREMVAAGAIPQSGRKGAPRIRRGDLPRRAAPPRSQGYDPQEDAARILAARTR